MTPRIASTMGARVTSTKIGQQTQSLQKTETS